MKRIPRVVISIGLVGGALVAPSLDARACAQVGSSNSLLLGEFPNESTYGNEFYYAAENAGSTNFEIHRISDDCSGTAARTWYTVDSGTATKGTDFTATQGQSNELFDPGHGIGPHSQIIPVPLINDAQQEAAVESATVRLYDPQNAVLIDPSRAPLYIIDDEGPTRYSLGQTNVEQSETNTRVQIPVFRGGSVVSSSSVSFTITPTTSSPATPGEDFTVPSSTTVSFPAGDRVQVITLQIINDDRGESSEGVNVTLQNADPQGIAETTLTILDNEESIAPVSEFHHPRHGVTYNREVGDYRLREIHVFANDENRGSGVVAVQLAMRRKKVDGSCGWWDGDSFSAGDCAAKEWLKMHSYESSDLFYRRFPILRPSIGTNILKYTAYSRARDGAGNVEKVFERGRNANTFEVARPN